MRWNRPVIRWGLLAALIAMTSGCCVVPYGGYHYYGGYYHQHDDDHRHHDGDRWH